MKCVKNHLNGEIRRVTEYEAKKLAAYGWTYVTKGEWKRAVRPKANPSALKARAKELVKGMAQGIRRI